MKKFEVIFYTFIILVVIAYFVCAIVVPDWTAFVCAMITGFLNTPIIVAGISTTLGGIIAFIIAKFIMNNSKFGRKELDGIKKELENAKDELSQYKESINLELCEKANMYENLKNECNNQVTIMLEQFESLQKETLAALKTIPNKKVQAIVAEYEAKYEEEKQEIIDKTVYTNDYINNKLNELRQDMEKMLNEAKERINSETEAA